MTAALLDHLWQSTLFAAAIWLIMPLFRSNSASVRFWLWFAASVKFLVPLAIFTIAGRHLLTLSAPVMPARLVSALEPVATPFSVGGPVMRMPVTPHLMLLDLAVAAWFLGAMAVLGLWLLRSLKLLAHLRRAADLPAVAAVPVKSAYSALEPGLVGIWRPVILLPAGITENLSPLEMEAVIAHELCHLRRRDNLLAAVHMLVEALFWFHPLVWWLGSRLVEEREHACDESVLAAGNQPLVYAQGILKVCRFYIQSPLACASGVSGAVLETRVRTILRNRSVDDVDGTKSALLISAAVVSVMLPLLAGSTGSGPITHIASRVAIAIAARTAQVSLPVAMMPEAQTAPHKLSPHRARRHAARVAPAIAPTVMPIPDEIAATSPPAVAVPLAIAVPAANTATAAPPQADSNVSVKALSDAPASLVCRPPQQLPASHFFGPQVCLRKDQWARLRAWRKDISADGRAIVDAAEEKQGCMSTFRTNYSFTGIFCF